MRRRLARLNHILIPSSRAERDRLRHSRVGRVATVIGALFYRVTPEAQLVAALAFFAGITGLDVPSTDVHMLFALMSATLLASLIVSQFYRLRAVRIEASCAPRVTIGDEQRFTITLKNTSDQDISRAQVLGPFLPWDGQWVDARPTPVRLDARSVASAELRARFHQRGQHHLDPFVAGAVAPLGLAVGPVIQSDGCRFVVVPKVATVLSLRMPQPRAIRSGNTTLDARAGDSMDLLGVRDYRPGDRVRDLHARSWARTGRPVVREYMQESITAVGVLLDPSGEDDESFDARLSLTAGMLDFIARGQSIAELLVANPQGRELVLGSRFASLDHALELLACTDPCEPQSPEALAARVERREFPWSRALLVCGGVGPWQRAVVQALLRVGIPCGIYVVADPKREPERESTTERVLSTDRVLRGREGLLL
ncbi:MAG: DUF58 domain-containing protein [Polyangiales bacterium]